jgi:hypothetical protein
VGIHRINVSFVEEFYSPGDLRFRVETDVRMPRGRAGLGFIRRLRAAVESSQNEKVRDLLLERLKKPVRKRERVTNGDLIQVRRMITGALSDPRKKLPPEEGGLPKKGG